MRHIRGAQGNQSRMRSKHCEAEPAEVTGVHASMRSRGLGPLALETGRAARTPAPARPPRASAVPRASRGAVQTNRTTKCGGVPATGRQVSRTAAAVRCPCGRRIIRIVPLGILLTYVVNVVLNTRITSPRWQHAVCLGAVLSDHLAGAGHGFSRSSTVAA
jgi:hypothetical protein